MAYSQSELEVAGVSLIVLINIAVGISQRLVFKRNTPKAVVAKEISLPPKDSQAMESHHVSTEELV